MQDLLETMRDRVLNHFAASQITTPIPRVSVTLSRGVGDAETTMCGPGFCLVLQGTKQLVIGNQALKQGSGQSFASLIELPATRCLYETARRDPYVAVGLTVDPVLLSELLTDLPLLPPLPELSSFSVAEGTPDLLEARNQHLALLDAPVISLRWRNRGSENCCIACCRVRTVTCCGSLSGKRVVWRRYARQSIGCGPTSMNMSPLRPLPKSPL
ncbi:AraC family transcriptional regulator [Devosia sp. A8/3-2]|nr:AraC family transcriptional regulator [Devosia sp. A8/3-2]